MSFDAFTALGTLAQAGSQIGTGIQARKAANQQSELSTRAAQAAREDELRKGRRLAGKQRAAFGKSGVKIDEGTPLDVLAQTAADAELNAIRAAFEFEQQADNFRSAGKIQLTRGILGAGATILGKAEVFRDLFPSGKTKPIVGPTTGAPPTSHTASFGRFA
jgi:hypothetical protein